MNCSHLFNVGIIVLATLSYSRPVIADTAIRVDVGAADGRRDTGTPHWETWKVEDGAEAKREFGDVTITLRPVGRAEHGIRGFLTKAGIDTGATMATDGIMGAVGIEIQIKGLVAGRHTIVTYHNAIWDESAGSLNVSCHGTKPDAESIEQVTGLRPSQKVAHNDDAASAFLSFVAVADKPVVIRIVADARDGRQPALLNGFEIDRSDPLRLARKPAPAHDDEHVDGDSGSVELRWTPAMSAVRHDVYVAADRDAAVAAARVAAAGRDDAEFLLSVTTPHATHAKLDITDNDSLVHYCWRVDEVDRSGQVTRGDVWRFRVRHLAFPGAEGYGRHARGGRGGRVIAVTNLNDSGPGSLRAAVEAEGPRTVVFHVSGLITLKSKLIVTRENSHLTVAGQTAPGKGICIRNWSFGTIGARDVIIRHVRLRLGDLAGKTMDGMGLASANHAILDHCSISWTIDEAFSSRQARNITLQRCLISEALNEARHEKYAPGKRHGFAASIGGDVGSFHHNLLAHCAGRNWSLAGGINQSNRHAGRLDIRNNVVYNWHNRTTDGGAMQVNFVNNYYKPGPASTIKTYLNPQFENPAFGPQQYYVAGNVTEGVRGPEGPTGPFEGMNVRGRQQAAVTVPEPFFEHHVSTHTAQEAYENVLADVGCNVPALDEHDRRVIEEVRTGKATFKGSKTGLPGLPDTQADVGGWEDYPEIHRPPNWDTDGDGIPNDWETQKDLNPNSAKDGATDPDGDGYTNLEDYLNWLAAGSPAADATSKPRRADASAQQSPPSPHRRVEPVRLSEVKWTDGFWHERLATCRDKTIPAMWEIMRGTKYKPYFEHFCIAAGLSEGSYRGAPFNDGDFYKWIEAVCALQAAEPDPKWDILPATDTRAQIAKSEGAQPAAIADHGALEGHRYRVLVSTDIGGTDPDDFQSMVHLLVYADCFDLEGLISSPYGPGRKEHILKVIDCYARDYANLKTHSEMYPAPDTLRAITKQGEIEVAPYGGVRRSTAGSEWIVRCARRDDPRPLYVLVWGGIEDLAQALHDAPEILPKLRVYWIGGPNKKWSPDAYQYLADHHPKLWIIEANSTYRGWFTGGNQSGDWGNRAFVARHVAGKGALGEFFQTHLGGTIKMGDTPSVGWLLVGTPDDPSQPGWGGRFVRAWERPYTLLDRLPTKDDRMQVFGILELALPLGAPAPRQPEARLLVENQSLAGHAADDGTMRFRFSPKEAKTYRFNLESNVPALDKKTGSVTSFATPPDAAQRASARHPNWWTDDPAASSTEGVHGGAKTVSRWREDYLHDFAERMMRCQSPTGSKSRNAIGGNRP